MKIEKLEINHKDENPPASEVERQLGYKQGNISNCCNGKRKTCGGFKWQYKKDKK